MSSLPSGFAANLAGCSLAGLLVVGMTACDPAAPGTSRSGTPEPTVVTEPSTQLESLCGPRQPVTFGHSPGLGAEGEPSPMDVGKIYARVGESVAVESAGANRALVLLGFDLEAPDELLLVRRERASDSWFVSSTTLCVEGSTVTDCGSRLRFRGRVYMKSEEIVPPGVGVGVGSRLGDNVQVLGCGTPGPTPVTVYAYPEEAPRDAVTLLLDGAVIELFAQG